MTQHRFGDDCLESRKRAVRHQDECQQCAFVEKNVNIMKNISSRSRAAILPLYTALVIAESGSRPPSARKGWTSLSNSSEGSQRCLRDWDI